MSKNKITKAEVKKIAELTKLHPTEKETEKLAEMFTDTLFYMDMLNELDTDDVQETYQVTGLTNVFQNGETSPSLGNSEALQNAKEEKDDYFVTAAVLER